MSAVTSQPIRFARAVDGVRLAYATLGRGIPIVRTGGWLGHLEVELTSRVWRRWIEEMVKRYALTRFDTRGCGLSDREVGDLSFDAAVGDFEAVVDAARLERFAILGMSQGAAVAIAYAVRHPERVSHLILYGGYLRGMLRRDPTPTMVEEAGVMRKLMELGWGREDSAFRQVFATQFVPDSTLEHLQSFDELQRRAATPSAAARMLEAFFAIDVAAVAPAVQCPTLVMHSRGDLRAPFEEGRRIASTIPSAEFVPLESRNHVLLEHQPAWQQFFDEIDGFFRRHPFEPAASGTVGSAQFDSLTPRERDVLDLLAAGLVNPDIAKRLRLAEKTVRNHVNHLFDKLGCSSRGEAIVRAREAGFGRGAGG